MMIPDEDVTSGGDHQIVTAKEVRGDAEAHVAQPLAEQQQTIGLLDELPHGLGADRSQIRADELFMARRKHAAAQERRGHRNSQAFSQSNDRLSQAEPMNLDADDQHGQPARESRWMISAAASATAVSSTFSSTSLKFDGTGMSASTACHVEFRDRQDA